MSICLACVDNARSPATCRSYEVSWNGRCYYLDGFGGHSQSTNAVLTCIASNFTGKTYATTTSNSCCVWTADTYECYGM